MSAAERAVLERERTDLLHELDPWRRLSGPRIAVADRLIVVESLLLKDSDRG